jgi:hypothetical protein
VRDSVSNVANDCLRLIVSGLNECLHAGGTVPPRRTRKNEMAKAKSKKRATAATRSAKKNVAALVKAAEARKRSKAPASSATAGKTLDASATEGGAASGGQRWKGMSIEQLRALYLETLGRPTESDNRTYLIWKIREAEKGNVPIGPTTRKLFEGPTIMVTMKFEEAFVDELDAAGEHDGFKARLAYLRDLIGKGLEVRGRPELAAKLGGA